MKERPILFSAAMVRAILNGTKTQTRRVVAFPRTRDAFVMVGEDGGWWPYQSDDGESPLCDDGNEHRYSCPYGQPGDRLWVRETHAIVPRTAYGCSDGVQQILRPGDDHDAAIFREGWTRSRSGFRWRPSIHMPRWASRITLEVTSVRAEQLKDIGPEDCEAEGVQRLPLQEDSANPWYSAAVDAGSALHSRSTIGAYRKLWEFINGTGSWDANPWVWVVEFKRLEAA